MQFQNDRSLGERTNVSLRGTLRSKGRWCFVYLLTVANRVTHLHSQPQAVTPKHSSRNIRRNEAVSKRSNPSATRTLFYERRGVGVVIRPYKDRPCKKCKAGPARFFRSINKQAQDICHMQSTYIRCHCISILIAGSESFCSESRSRRFHSRSWLDFWNQTRMRRVTSGYSSVYKPSSSRM